MAFNSNGGSSVPRQRIKKGGKVAEPTDPTRQYYEFDEWQKDSETYNFNTPVTSNFTLVATWKNIEGVIDLVNRGSASLSYTATPVEGATETGTIAAGATAELAQAINLGDAISTVYSSISVQYEGEEARTIDTTQVIVYTVTPFEFTDWSEEGNMITIVNATSGSVSVVYKKVGDDSDTTQTIVSGGAYDLPYDVADNETIGDVYAKLQATYGQSGTWSADLTTVVTDDIVYTINDSNVSVDTGEPSPGASGGKLPGGIFPFN